MKKLMASLVLGGLMLPSIALAQTVDNSSLIALLYQLIATLEQEIAAIQASQMASTTPEMTLATSTQQTAPLFGTIVTTAIPPQSTEISPPSGGVVVPVVQSTPMGISVTGWDGTGILISDGAPLQITVIGKDLKMATSTEVQGSENGKVKFSQLTDQNGQVSMEIIHNFGSGSHEIDVKVPSLGFELSIPMQITNPPGN